MTTKRVALYVVAGAVLAMVGCAPAPSSQPLMEDDAGITTGYELEPFLPPCPLVRPELRSLDSAVHCLDMYCSIICAGTCDGPCRSRCSQTLGAEACYRPTPEMDAFCKSRCTSLSCDAIDPGDLDVCTVIQTWDDEDAGL